MELALPWAQLIVAAALILAASLFLTRSADVIAVKTGLGRSFVGVVLLATATSLPELGTGISSVAYVGNADLAFGGAFGSNLFNLMIIGLLNLYWWKRFLFTRVGVSSVVVATLGVAVMAMAAASTLLHGRTDAFDALPLSPMSIALLASFAIAMYFIFQVERQTPKDGAPSDAQDARYAGARLSAHLAIYAGAAGVVVAAAVWLSAVSDGVATEMGWDASFMGTQFLAAATSLPEFATSFAALRIAAPELAITNLLGSNLFNMGFVLFLDDVAYTKGAIWSAASPVHAFTAAVSILMTTVVIMAVATRPLSPRPRAADAADTPVGDGRRAAIVAAESGLLIGLYALGSFLVFALS